MELFYSKELGVSGMPVGAEASLTEEDSQHCVKVLRHRDGDNINVIDGQGNLYGCTIVSASARNCIFRIDSCTRNWGSHPYRLHIACAPTKSSDRFEWFAEKATEIGIDSVIPVICRHSERKVMKTERLERILLSATKQSLKGLIPSACECIRSDAFINSMAGNNGLKLIAYCFDDSEGAEKISIADAIKRYLAEHPDTTPEITVMIGPEGDFSEDEVNAALKAGFIPVSLGPSRLRTETAALTAAACVYSLTVL